MKDFITEDWELYERSKTYLESKGFYNRIEKAYRFVGGEQWDKNAPEGLPQPQLNILKPMTDYKVATVLRNGISLHFSNAEFKNQEVGMFTDMMCDKLNNFVAKVWEDNSMDTKMWDVAKDACVSGGVAIYSYLDEEGNIKTEQKDNVEILVADEQQKDIQKQRYIIIPYRRLVGDVREEAKSNGINDIKSIIPDETDKEKQFGYGKTEVEYENEEFGKCLCLLKMWKDKQGYVHFRKSTKAAVFMNDTKTLQKMYPIAYLDWNKIKGSFRGSGDVTEWIRNQVEINVNLARIALSITYNAFPKIAYNKDAIENPQDVMTVGNAIAIENVEDVRKLIAYIEPQAISPDAMNYVNNLINFTQMFAGKDTTSDINPENASGKAILAVQDANAVPLSTQVSKVKKFVEDIGRIWWDIWASSSIDGFTFTFETTADIPKLDDTGATELDNNGQPVTEERKIRQAFTIPPELLSEMKLAAKVDVSPQTTFSKYAVEASLDNMLTSGLITLAEYTDVLPDDSIMPKQKIKKIIEDRQEQEKIMQELQYYKQNYEELAKAIQTYKSEGDSILQGLFNAQNAQQGDENKAANEPVVENKELPTN